MPLPLSDAVPSGRWAIHLRVHNTTGRQVHLRIRRPPDTPDSHLRRASSSHLAFLPRAPSIRHADCQRQRACHPASALGASQGDLHLHGNGHKRSPSSAGVMLSSLLDLPNRVQTATTQHRTSYTESSMVPPPSLANATIFFAISAILNARFCVIDWYITRSSAPAPVNHHQRHRRHAASNDRW